MAVTVKKATLWRKEVENRPGELADTLEPLVGAGADLKVVMGYRYGPGDSKAAIELYPVAGRKALAAAKQAGLSGSTIPTLVVEGDDKPGLGHAIAKALADAEDQPGLRDRAGDRPALFGGVRLRERGRRYQSRAADQEGSAGGTQVAMSRTSRR